MRPMTAADQQRLRERWVLAGTIVLWALIALGSTMSGHLPLRPIGAPPPKEGDERDHP